VAGGQRTLTSDDLISRRSWPVNLAQQPVWLRARVSPCSEGPETGSRRRQAVRCQGVFPVATSSAVQGSFFIPQPTCRRRGHSSFRQQESHPRLDGRLTDEAGLLGRSRSGSPYPARAGIGNSTPWVAMSRVRTGLKRVTQRRRFARTPAAFVRLASSRRAPSATPPRETSPPAARRYPRDGLSCSGGNSRPAPHGRASGMG
jgi:hypothetical protein